MQGNKKTQRREKKVTELSDLGDDLLSHILSFLTLEEAIQTSILCKRWQYEWVPHSLLNLTRKGFQSTYGFLKVIQKTRSPRGSSKPTKFELKSRTNSSSVVESLISTATKCDVEECELHLQEKLIKDPIFFPFTLHNSTTLTCLEIKMTHQVRLIAHPSICHLPNLKILKLLRVTLFEQRPTQSLFSGCLALEELHLEHCLWEGVSTVTVPSSNLHTLVIEEPLCDFSCNPKIGNEFVISGDNLQQFNYRGRLFFNYRILNNTSLKECKIDYCCLWDKYQKLIEKRFKKLLSHTQESASTPSVCYDQMQIRQCRYCE